jgi:hypothetical protein
MLSCRSFASPIAVSTEGAATDGAPCCRQYVSPEELVAAPRRASSSADSSPSALRIASEFENRMAVRLLDETLHRVLGLGVKERGCYPNVSDVLLKDWSRFHWLDFVSKHRFSHFAAPQRHLVRCSDVVDPVH